VQDARLKTADNEEISAQLGEEAARIESLLASLREAEARVAAERNRAQGLLDDLMEADAAAPGTNGGDDEATRGPAWQETQTGARERAETLLASWTDAEREAAAERQRTEGLLEGLLSAHESARAPPPVPPPKPALGTVATEPAPDSTPPALPDTGPPLPGDEGSRIPGPGEVQLAYNLVDESQAARPRESLAPGMPRAELENYLRAHKNDLEDKLIAHLQESGIPKNVLQNATWRSRVKILDMEVEDAFDDTVYLEIRYRRGESLKEEAGPDTFAMRWVDGALEFMQIEEATTSATPPRDVNAFDGKWSGQASLVKQTMANTSGPACMNRLKLDLQISGNTVIGFVKGLRASFNGALSGAIDASGNLEGHGSAGHRLVIHGSLSADTGEGSGLWSTTHCEGTLEIARRDGARERAASGEIQTARLDTVSSDGASALARFDGRWTGKGTNIMAAGGSCPGTIAIEMQVLDGKITGFQTAATGSTWGTGHLTGTIDASGRLETDGPLYHLRGALSVDSGRGSGEWTRGDKCRGTFEIARVE
jgi:hypothetical protein